MEREELKENMESGQAEVEGERESAAPEPRVVYISPKRRRRRRKLRTSTKLVLFVLITAGLIVFCLKADLFNIRAIEVENNSHYTAEQIIQLSGARQGENIFTIDKSGMRARLLVDPYIKGVDIRRKFPNTLIIDAEERIEAAAIAYGSEYALLDTDGMVLAWSAGEPALPILEGLTIKTVDPGSPLEVEETTLFTDTLYLIMKTREAQLQFKRIDISNVIVKAYIYDALVCKGRPENLIASVENGELQAVLKDLYDKNTERGTINVVSSEYISFDPAVE